MTKKLQQLITAEPDLVDRIFDYILSEFPRIGELGAERVGELKTAVRSEFKGEECYIAGRPATARQELVAQILSLFNGRNTTEVARRLNISRATVYRVIKQTRIEAGSESITKVSQLS